MNHRVPDFHEMEEDCAIPTSAGLFRPRKTAIEEDEIMELMWQNGQVMVQKSANRAPYVGGGEAAEQAVVREIRGSGAEEGQHLFMQEDEMASWLQYPIEDSSFTRDLYADDLFYTAPVTSAAPPQSVAEIRPQPAPPRPPPVPPPPQKSGVSPHLHTFGHFSRLPSRPRIEPASKPLVNTVRESTVVESNETPKAVAAPEFGVSQSRRQVYARNGNAAVRGGLARLPCEVTVTSSVDGGSRASFSSSAEPSPPNEKAPQSEAAEDRKRKAREDDDNECQSEDFEYEATEAKKQSRGATSTKRSRAAEVHNLSERRRRDRINEKMKALQELIPRCNKSDKASMLDEAIEYMKSLQMQLQMMSMGCGMVPMMYPGMQQYMPTMLMGMGMNRPMMPYPSMVPGSPMPNPANMGPRFPMPPGFHLPQTPLPDNCSRIQGSNSNDPTQNSSQPGPHNFVDPYHQFLGHHHQQQQQQQSPLPQASSIDLRINQGGVQLTATKQDTNKEDRNPENKQSGKK
ncbi:hypothetical protein ABFS82_04G048900 [Erythranthe guttata]